MMCSCSQYVIEVQCILASHKIVAFLLYHYAITFRLNYVFDGTRPLYENVLLQ